MIADQRSTSRTIGERLQLKADAGERLQHAVVQIAGDAQAILTHRDLLQLVLNVEVLERVADFARHDLGERDHVGSGR